MMRNVMSRALMMVVVLALFGAVAGAVDQPWQKLYAGEDALGDNVIALWQFQPGAEGADSSGNGHKLKPRGKSKFVEGGKFGNCLQVFSAHAGPKNHAEGAVSRKNAAFSPKGAFTVEGWVKLGEVADPEVAKKTRSLFLFDCKYYHYSKPTLPKANTGYNYWLTLNKDGKWTPHAMLGFGKDSVHVAAPRIELKAGEWVHMALTYDGKGTLRLIKDGKDIGGKTFPDRGDITPAVFDFTIGSRFGSTYESYPCCFDQVRISKGVVKFAPAE